MNTNRGNVFDLGIVTGYTLYVLAAASTKANPQTPRCCW